MQIPPIVRNKAVALGAEPWLDGLPELLAELTAAWGLTVGAAFPDATEALVLEAALGDGTQGC